MRNKAILAAPVIAVVFLTAVVAFAAAPKKDAADNPFRPGRATLSAEKAAPAEPVAPIRTTSPTETQQPSGDTENSQITTTTSIQTVTAVSPATGEQIKWQVIGSGGGSSSSASYKLSSTIGQTAAGPVSSASYKINQGFWQSFGSSCCVGTRGNVNMTGIIDLGDLSLLICYLTCAPKPTLPCSDAANVNGAGIIDLSDLSMLIAYLTVAPKPTLPPCP